MIINYMIREQRGQNNFLHPSFVQVAVSPFSSFTTQGRTSCTSQGLGQKEPCGEALRSVQT